MVISKRILRPSLSCNCSNNLPKETAKLKTIEKFMEDSVS